MKSEETIRILIASIIGFGLAAAPAFASCVPDSVQNGKSALLDVPVDKRVELTAKTLKMACNWPADIELALVGIFQAPPEYQPSIDLEAASAYPELWNRVCVGGKEALNQATKLDAIAARTHIYRSCGIERVRFATEEEKWHRASPLRYRRRVRSRRRPLSPPHHDHVRPRVLRC